MDLGDPWGWGLWGGVHGQRTDEVNLCSRGSPKAEVMRAGPGQLEGKEKAWFPRDLWWPGQQGLHTVPTPILSKPKLA